VVCNHYILSGNEFWSPTTPHVTTPEPGQSRRSVVTSARLQAEIKTPPLTLMPQRSEPLKESIILPPMASTSTSVLECLLPSQSNGYLRNLIALNERAEFFPYVPSHFMDNYGLLALGGPGGPKPFEFNSILMAAMGVTLPFSTATAPTAKLFSTSRPFPLTPVPILGFDGPPVVPQIGNPPTDLGHMFLSQHAASMANAVNSWTPTYPTAFQPYPSPTGILSEGLPTRQRSSTDNPNADESGRRRRLDAKTIESFEVAMIKNELTVSD